MVPSPELPSPSQWGWNKSTDGEWEVNWTTLPEATQACRELIRCGCKKGCRGRCKCQKAALECTALCSCGGLCGDCLYKSIVLLMIVRKAEKCINLKVCQPIIIVQQIGVMIVLFDDTSMKFCVS